MQKNGGLLSAQDLADYRPIVTEPLSTSFNVHSVNVVPTPSGGITNLETLGILDRLDLRSLSHNSVEHLDLLIQAVRHAFADRYRYLGDRNHVPVPLEGLLSPQYLGELAAQVNAKKADIGLELDEEPWGYYMDRAVDDPWKYDPSSAPELAYQPADGNGDGDTTHFNAVDRERNAVSCTHTSIFGPGVNAPSTGVYLTGGMAWFIPKAGYANSIASWKRPMNNMSPLMVFREGRPILCQGAPGGRRIMNRGVQVVTNIVVYGMTPQEAIVQPTVDASGRDTLLDSRLPDEVVDGLEKLGHRVLVVEEEPGMGSNFSRPSAIHIDYESGLLTAGVDAFRPATALGD